ncbi:MAG: hypothetical protein RLZZ540_2053 [Bacteroidota bacterium]|jgi:PAS domain S-box-containing protein
MVNKLKASIELTLLVFIMTLFVIGSSIYGFFEIRHLNNSSKELYADRLLPMDNLADIRYYSTALFSIAHQAKTKQITFKEASQKVKQAQDSIAFNWKAYKLTYFTPKESQIVAETSALLKRSNVTVEKLRVILERNDAESLEDIIKKELYPVVNPVIENITLLLNLQIKIGKNIRADTSVVYTDYVNKFFYLLIVVFAIAIPFTYYLMKKNRTIIDGFNLRNNQLITSESNYRNLIEYAGDAILILNEETEIIDLNEAACTLFGYTREELLEINISELVPSDEIEKQIKDVALIRKNKFAQISRKIRRKDGSFIQAEVNNRLMDGKGFFAIIRDVTDRNNAEEVIRKSEEKYRYLFDNNPAYIIIWDLETLEVLEINNAVLCKYGYSKDEWSRMSVLDYRPKEDCSKIEEFAKYISVIDEPIVTKNWSHYKKNGEEMIMEIASHKIDYNNRKAILSLANDVTNQLKAEEKLKEREAQLDLFIEHSPASLAMFDKEMRYIKTSNRWIEDYNLSGQNIIGKSHYEVFPEIGQEWKDIHQRCLQGVVEKREEDVFLRGDGSVDWVKWEIRPWHKSTGEIGGVIMFTEVITERKKATEMFKNQFDNAPDTILYINKSLKIEAINKDGFMWTKEELVGMDCISVLPEESQEFMREIIMECFEKGVGQEIENPLHGDRWVRSRLVPLFTEGKVTHIVIFATDITQQRKSEQKLLESEEKHRVLTENISDAILLLNENFELEFQSLSAERIVGYNAQEVLGKSVFDFIHPDEFDKAAAFFNQLRNAPGIPMQNQFRVIHKEGYVIWIEGTVLNLLENKNIGAFIVNYRDISSRKKFEEQQALMASIVNSTDDAIISKDIEGIITSWNVGAENVLGYTAIETIGKHVTMFVPLDLRDEERKILEAIRKGDSVDHYETKRKKKNGEIIDVSLTISPIRDVLGNIVGASKIMRDMTDRKKFEDDLIRYNAELKKTNSELDRFVYSASHDLRAPLKSMLGLIYVTKESVNPDDSELHERLAMLNNTVEKLDDFIEDILHYSRNARMGLDKDEIDFEKIVEEIKGSHKFIEGIKGVQFHLSVSSEGLFVSDYRRLGVILNNILSNALKYRDVSKEKSFVNIIIRSNKTNAIVIIEDNGVGIATNDKDKIFEMFYRATTLSSGSGLGLYIVKEALEKLGGTINVESELNKGTKFIVEIPNQINN